MQAARLLLTPSSLEKQTCNANARLGAFIPQVCGPAG
jgi:hypothetical protein